MKLASQEIRDLLAPFYEKACRNEQTDMKDMTVLMEMMRESFTQHAVFEAWANIRLDRKKFDKEPYISYLAALKKKSLTLAGDKIINEIKQNGFKAWEQYYAEALIWWIDPVYHRLCETDFPFDEHQKQKINEYKHLNELIRDNKWIESYSTFFKMSENKQFNDVTRSYLKVVAGQIKLFWLPDYPDALQFFQEALKLHPENNRAGRAIGEYHVRMEEFDLAKNQFLKIISAAPNYVDNYLSMGNAYKDEDHTDTAMQWYNDALEINFMESYVYSRLLSVYNTSELLQDKEKLIDDYIAKVSMIDPDTPSGNGLYNFYRDIAYAYLTATEYDKAIDFYSRADKLKKNLVSAKIDIAYTYSYKGQYKDGIKWFNKALKNDTKWDFDVHWGFAWLYEQMAQSSSKDTEKRKYMKNAIHEYEWCATAREGWAEKCYNSIGVLYYNIEDYATAAAYYDKAIALNPKEGIYYDNKKDALEKAGASDAEIESLLVTTSELFPENEEYHNRLGVMYYRQGKYEQAINYYNKAISIDDASALFYENRGLAFLYRLQYEKAEADFLRSMELNPVASIYNNLGVLYYRMGNMDNAIKYYTEAIKLNEQEPVYHENIGLAYEKKQDDEKALACFEQAVSLEKELGTYLNRIGLYYYKRENDNKAIEYYKRALEKEPGNSVYAENMALAYEQLGQDDDAEQIYRAIVQKDHSNTYSRMRLAVMKMRNGHYDDEAKQLLEHILALTPGDGEILQYLGYYYEKRNEPDNALEVYKRALTYHKSDEYFNNRAGIIHFNRGNKADTAIAIEYYKKAIEANKEFAVYWQNLGLAYERLENYPEAEKAYLQSIVLDSNNAEYHNFLGVFYHNHTKEYSKAVEQYQKAIAIDPQSTFYTNLSLAYELLGKTELAQQAQRDAGSAADNKPYTRTRM